MTEQELRKLTIAQLREMIDVPSKLKKKDDIILYILQFGDGLDPQVKRMKTPQPHSGQKTMESMFSVPSKLGENACSLCCGEGTVWCELGIAKCPICFPAKKIESPPLIKLERIRGDDNTIVDPLTGEITFNMTSVDRESLVALVTSYGFGICESIDVLGDVGNDVDLAVEKILNRTRSSAENYSFSQAQLNSEEVRDKVRLAEIQNRKSGREHVHEDVSVLETIDSDFVKKFGRKQNLIQWIHHDPILRSVIVYDYLVLKRDAIKWYKEPAQVYFERSESDGFSMCDEWFIQIIEKVRDAMFNIPETAGGIPVLFRQFSVSQVSEIGDIEVVGESVKTADHVILIDD
jgi:hypothetical protein